MKKFFCLFSVLALLIGSCSDNDGTSSDSGFNINGTKLKRAILNSNAASGAITYDYFYNGNRLARIVSSDMSYFKYTYTDELITKIEFFKNNVLKNIDFLEYNNDNKLITRKQIRGNTGYKVVYTHNNDGTISIFGYTGDSVNQNTPTDLNKKVFFVNGLVSKIESYSIIDGSLETLFTNYTHDTANTPTSLILGYDKLTYYDQGNFQNVHNLTSITYSSTVNDIVDVDEIVNVYNADNFLSKATAVDLEDNNGPPLIFEYFYE
ncbi:hypothetical protein FEDK69T_15760 [Flavobacterium enshiense DK69]|uniref:DUF4595 domain-containing protein n=1 Tax=Flavobacterium enshiense DK69 TaxID=1107311 RepID=V6SG67_9FLAO|nr:hypothetical protein [Flavobacterium enshiense]ESU23410.1 hypothetical protein FEDK69T_15760 [Flavobacterium enshiense DK69]KGO96364.1 hypothetical protein Q767_05470 [Flavobacterium enshiense DK69]